MDYDENFYKKKYLKYKTKYLNLKYQGGFLRKKKKKNLKKIKLKQ